MLAPLPTSVDLAQDWNVRYFADKFGVSRGRLTQAVGVVGPEEKKLGKFFGDGHRIAIRDESGVIRQVARISLQRDGFGVSVPYHPVKEGWVFETPMPYDREDFELGQHFVPATEMKHYVVSDTVKLSLHMDGFVQFSKGGERPIVSGYNAALGQIRGAGLKAPDGINITSGPLFGIVFQGLSEFEPHSGKPVELFEPDDLWFHPEFATKDDTAYNLEAFMLPGDLREAASLDRGRRLLARQLPFYSRFKFSHVLRVIELPHLPFILGFVLSPIRPDDTIQSGYKLAGPGCRGADGEFRGIAAWYPRPGLLRDADEEFNPASLDYRPPESMSE